jgi:hypothetical protein
MVKVFILLLKEFLIDSFSVLLFLIVHFADEFPDLPSQVVTLIVFESVQKALVKPLS